MMIDRRKEITGTAGAFDDVFAALIRRADDAAGLDAAPCPNIGEGARPMVASGLQR